MRRPVMSTQSKKRRLLSSMDDSNQNPSRPKIKFKSPQVQRAIVKRQRTALMKYRRRLERLLPRATPEGAAIWRADIAELSKAIDKLTSDLKSILFYNNPPYPDTRNRGPQRNQ